MKVIKGTENPKVIFMHCLPSIHDDNTEIGEMVYNEYSLKEMKVKNEVFRSKHLVVFDEAESRLHTIKAVMIAIIGN